MASFKMLRGMRKALSNFGLKPKEISSVRNNLGNMEKEWDEIEEGMSFLDYQKHILDSLKNTGEIRNLNNLVAASNVGVFKGTDARNIIDSLYESSKKTSFPLSPATPKTIQQNNYPHANFYEQPKIIDADFRDISNNRVLPSVSEPLQITSKTTSAASQMPQTPKTKPTPAHQEATSTPSTQKTYNSLEQRLADVKDGRANNEMRKRMPIEFKNAKERFVNAKNDEERINIMKNYGVENYKPGTSQEDVFKSLEQSFVNKVDQGPSAGDYFNGYHGRSILAVGVAGSAVANLFTSKGRLSNNQLYSDPFA